MHAPKPTLDDYHRLEAASELRHEFVNGDVLAMAGAELSHNLVVGALADGLRAATRPQGCRVVSSDQRVLVGPTGAWLYPDVVVVCGAAELVGPKPQALANPTFLAEVLSESTVAYDRGAKALHYQRIPSLVGYALVDPDQRTLEIYVRQAHGGWHYTVHRDGVAHIGGLDAGIDVAALFADLEAQAG